MERDRSLLDELTARSDLPFVSDIRCAVEGKNVYLVGSILSVIEQLPSEQYPLREWNQALRYMTNEPEQETPQEAKDRLCKALAAICAKE